MTYVDIIGRASELDHTQTHIVKWPAEVAKVPPLEGIVIYKVFFQSYVRHGGAIVCD